MTDDYNISASQVKTHSSCPKQYEYRYISDREPTKENEKYLQLGSRVHEAIENVIGDDESRSKDKRMLSSMLQKEYHQLEEYDVPDDIYDDGIKCCKTAARVIEKCDIEPVHIEKRQEYQIEHDGLSTGVTAIMDVVTESKVWDWKTGRIRDETSHEEKIQGSIYMAGFLELMGHPPDEVVFAYLKEEKIRKIEPGDDVWDYMVNYARKLMMSKEQSQFRATPGSQCYFCGYEFLCDGAPAGCGGVDPNDY